MKHNNNPNNLLLAAISILFATASLGCASIPPRRGFELPVALSEVYRNGALKPLQVADSPDLGMPIPTDRISHTCTSTPIYNLSGYYLRTDVRCY
jgi:hypothetical protein